MIGLDCLISIHLIYPTLQSQDNNADTITNYYDYWKQLNIFLQMLSPLPLLLKKYSCFISVVSERMTLTYDALSFLSFLKFECYRQLNLQCSPLVHMLMCLKSVWLSQEGLRGTVSSGFLYLKTGCDFDTLKSLAGYKIVDSHFLSLSILNVLLKIFFN